MSDDTSKTVAMPWYRSRIIQGILTIVVTQVIRRLQTKYSIDFALWPTLATDIVNGAMDGLSTFGVWWALHARVAPSVSIPPVVTLTKGQADEINSSAKLVVVPKEPGE